MGWPGDRQTETTGRGLRPSSPATPWQGHSRFCLTLLCLLARRGDRGLRVFCLWVLGVLPLCPSTDVCSMNEGREVENHQGLEKREICKFDIHTNKTHPLPPPNCLNTLEMICGDPVKSPYSEDHAHSLPHQTFITRFFCLTLPWGNNEVNMPFLPLRSVESNYLLEMLWGSAY